MYNSCFDNIFIGKYITYLPTCHSTNDIASELVQKGQLNDGDVVVTDFQTAGRGQRENKWQSDSGVNLLFSIYLKPEFIEIANQFDLSMAVSLGVCQFISKYVSNASIKWPNDLYIGDKKCCGMLIENTIAGSGIKKSIVGIGININQLQFETQRITSLAAATQSSYHLQELFPKLLASIEKNYLLLKNGHRDEIRKSYLNSLYGKGIKRTFKDSSGEFEGVIENIDQHGMLIINKGNNSFSAYGIKEIEWIW